MQPSNEAIIANYKDINLIKQMIKQNKEVIESETRRFNDNTELLHNCECVWKVIEGIALYHHGGCVGAIDKDITKRCARYYVNANDNDWWGLKTYDYEFKTGFGNDEQFHGDNWPTEIDVLEASIDWVINGTIPKLPVEYQI